jgi:hypothetical protein
MRSDILQQPFVSLGCGLFANWRCSAPVRAKAALVAGLVNFSPLLFLSRRGATVSAGACGPGSAPTRFSANSPFCSLMSDITALLTIEY